MRKCVRSADYRRLRRLLESSGYRVVELHGSAVTDKESFLAAVSEQIFGGPRAHNWSSFADLLRSTVWSLDEQRIALVWTDVHRMLDGSLDDLLTVVDIGRWLSDELHERERRFVIVLVGDGPNFRPLDSAWVTG